MLAEWSDSTGNFTTVTRMLLARLGGREGDFQTPRRQKSQMISYMYDGKYVFHCLESTAEIGLRFLVMTEKIAGIRMPYKFLLHLRQAFLSKYGAEQPLRSVALAYSDTFGPTMKDLHSKYNDCIEKGIEELPDGAVDSAGGSSGSSLSDLMRVREQVDAIQNVMVENIDEIFARSDKIDILVNRAESIMENTFEFRRQAQQYQRMMWWRQKKLIVGVFVAAVSSLAIVMSIEFGLPFRAIG